MNTDLFSPKQKIYIRIMEEILPYMRNIQTHSRWRRLCYGCFFAELELVHNLGRCVASAEFTMSDVYWLNSQARVYLKQGRKDLPFYDTICSLLEDLRLLVPAEMKVHLL